MKTTFYKFFIILQLFVYTMMMSCSDDKDPANNQIIGEWMEDDGGIRRYRCFKADGTGYYACLDDGDAPMDNKWRIEDEYLIIEEMSSDIYDNQIVYLSAYEYQVFDNVLNLRQIGYKSGDEEWHWYRSPGSWVNYHRENYLYN